MRATRWLLPFGLGVLTAFIAAVISPVLVALLYDSPFGYWDFREWIRLIEDIFSIPVAIGLFALFTLIVSTLIYSAWLRRIHRERDLWRMTEEVKEIADGRPQQQVRDKAVPSGEMVELAEQINRLVDRYRVAMEEERHAEMSKNDLITNVSHDLRTPLTSITGYLGLVEHDRYRDEVELRQYVSLAYEEAQRLQHLIEDLFEYTRTRSGGMQLRVSAIDMAEMLRQLAEAFRLRMSEAGLEARLSLPPGQLGVAADGNKLRRVFENLIANAIQYGSDGDYIDISGRMEGADVVVEVANYGDPIPRAELPHLFDRFYRVEKSRSAYTGGSGLGLAIARNIVELHRGRIAVASSPERTSFTVRLPASASPRSDGLGRQVQGEGRQIDSDS